MTRVAGHFWGFWSISSCKITPRWCRAHCSSSSNTSVRELRSCRPSNRYLQRELCVWLWLTAVIPAKVSVIDSESVSPWGPPQNSLESFYSCEPAVAKAPGLKTSWWHNVIRPGFLAEILFHTFIVSKKNKGIRKKNVSVVFLLLYLHPPGPAAGVRAGCGELQANQDGPRSAASDRGEVGAVGGEKWRLQRWRARGQTGQGTEYRGAKPLFCHIRHPGTKSHTEVRHSSPFQKKKKKKVPITHMCQSVML